MRLSSPTVVGIDPSLASLGLAAVVDQVVHSTSRIRSVGRSHDTLLQRSNRQDVIVAQVVDFTAGYFPDLIVIEGPAYGSKFGHAHDRSGLWWAIVSALLPGCAVVEVPPTNRMKYATGKGRADKDVVLAAAIKRYPSGDITGNDVADAVILAAMGSRHLGFPVEESLPLTHLAAMDAIRWQ